ncbi:MULTISPECIES: hypothetical protein [unclassified Flavobacterium]|uniref:hypothetical protein n=1 Tax=unclassified Flavobacterium TaxID=196869 RepID=UPI001F1372E1|nr:MULTISPECIES: hypothetical protein [unclassified Flavobacterium]UMY66826.1 hypothetical protein MKO97_05440 [Flavobacterium sp. HJ-32-4]
MKRYLPFLFLALAGCTDLDDTLRADTIVPDFDNVITQQDVLFTQVSQISNEDTDPLQHIVCIDFVYPLTVITYDGDLDPVAQDQIVGDADFSAFLGNLVTDAAISISYPISTTLADGSVFSIHNNEELKAAIDSCNRDDIIRYCNGLFCPPTPCVWNVDYVEGGRNGFVGGVFQTHPDGTLTFYYNGETYEGTWTFLFVNDNYHMNIYLGGTSALADYWQIDAPVIVTPDTIRIGDGNQLIQLSRSCETETAYSIGAVGPQGGLVCYDKGSYSEGWRYIEIMESDLPSAQWGCNILAIPQALQDGMGAGKWASGDIARMHGALVDFYTTPSVCSPTADGTVAAREVLLFGADVGHRWFLPSKAELQAIRDALVPLLPNELNGRYWSATDATGATAFVLDATTNVMSAEDKTTSGVHVRGIHYF